MPSSCIRPAALPGETSFPCGDSRKEAQRAADYARRGQVVSLGGAWAKQELNFEVAGSLEWLPRETIVFDGALADLRCNVASGNRSELHRLGGRLPRALQRAAG